MPTVAMTIADGLRLAAARPLQQLRESQAKFAITDGVVPVHDARVALRRLGALLRAVRPFVAKSELVELGSEMRWLRRILGAVRDLDVLSIDVISILRASLPHEGSLDALAAAVATRRQPAMVELIEAAESERCRQLIARLGVLFDTVAAEDVLAPLAGFAVKLLRRRFRKLQEPAHKIADLDDASLHRLRIRLRTLRYLCDCFASELPARRYANFRRAAIDLQDHLGAMNDTANSPRLVDNLIGNAIPRRPIDGALLARGAGLIAGWSAARRPELRAALTVPSRSFLERGDRLFDAPAR